MGKLRSAGERPGKAAHELFARHLFLSPVLCVPSARARCLSEALNEHPQAGRQLFVSGTVKIFRSLGRDCCNLLQKVAGALRILK